MMNHRDKQKQLLAIGYGPSALRSAILSLALLAMAGCTTEPQVEIPTSPAPPPTGEPQVLQGGSQSMQADESPATSDRGGTN